MAKIYNKKALLKSLGELIDNKIETVAAEQKDKLSLEDDAVEHAKAYWMLAFSWDEIETVLEDLGFSSDISKDAVKRAQIYAEETTKDGPFSMFMTGQLIKLKNGLVGKLLNKFAKKLQLKMFNDFGEVLVTAAQIDMDASLKLKEAFILRATANEVLSSIKENSFELNDIIAVSPVHCASKNLLTKIEDMQKHIVTAKEHFKTDKVVVSALGLEYAALDNLKDNLSNLQSAQTEEYTTVMPIYTKVADLLNSFQQERDNLVDNISDEQAMQYLDLVKQIVNIADQVIPEINAAQSAFDEAAKNKAKVQTEQNVKATLTYIK